MKIFAFLMSIVISMPVVAAELKSLDDSELSVVSGGDGIAIGLEYGVNTDVNGAPLASLGGCTGTGSVTATSGDRCRFSWQVAKQVDGSGNAAWTVAKNGWMSLRIPVLNLDVQPTMSGVGSNSTYFDSAKFTGYDGSGTSICLLPGGVCTAATINTLPALKLFYPAGSYNATTYTPGTGVSSGFTSLGLGLTIGRMAIEFDSGATPGYMRDANTGSFLGAQIKDNNGNFAMMAIGGSALIYGF